jgi:capsular polysaccharide biosynthesis protein
MSQQTLDLQKSLQIMRRHKRLLSIVVALGLLGGAGYAEYKPPLLTSTALVALPAPPPTTQQVTTVTGTDPFTATQEVVAGSYPVLVNALPDVRPSMSITVLRHHVQVGSPSADIISVTAEGRSGADAEATANAVADSYISYVSSSQSAVGRVQARLLQSATSATGPAPIERTVEMALLGGLAGVLIGVIVALAIGRNDRRLRERDEIAKSIGITVLASVPVAHPSTAPGWKKLLEDYKPTAGASWQLRTALQQLGVLRSGSVRPAYDGNGSSWADGRASAYHDGGRPSLLVLSLSSDSGALALGPQMAVFAASQRIPTALVIGPQQDAAATATLRTACAAQPSEASMHDGLLRVAAYDEGGVDLEPDTALVIVVAVIDSKAPKMPDTMRTNATVIAVSAGAATAEQLARAAVVAASDGREVTGILVGDPDPDDQTTGRVPHPERSARHSLPSRLPGIVTEIRR